MPWVLPQKLSAKLPMSRFKSEIDDVKISQDFILEKRKKAFRSDDTFLYRIVTREKIEGFRTKVAVGNDLDLLKTRQWSYLVNELPRLIPKELPIDSQQRMLWIMAHLTQLALGDTPALDDGGASHVSSCTLQSQINSPAVAGKVLSARELRDLEDHHARASPHSDGESRADPELDHGQTSEDVSDYEDVLHGLLNHSTGGESPRPSKLQGARPFIPLFTRSTTDGGGRRHTPGMASGGASLLDLNERHLPRKASVDMGRSTPTPAVATLSSPAIFAIPPPALTSAKSLDAAFITPRPLRQPRNRHTSDSVSGMKPPVRSCSVEERPAQPIDPFERLFASKYGFRAELLLLLFFNAVVLIHEWKVLLFWLNAMGLAAIVYRRTIRGTFVTRSPTPTPTPPVPEPRPARAKSSHRKPSALLPAPPADDCASTPYQLQPQSEASESLLAGKLDFGKTLKHCPASAASGTSDASNSWTEWGGDTFKVRVGPNYAQNKRKANSKPALYRVRSIDCYRTSNKVPHVTRFFNTPRDESPATAAAPTDAGGIGMPSVLVVNVMLPEYEPPNPVWGAARDDGPGVSLVFCFELTEETKAELRRERPSNAAALLRDFVNSEADSVLRQRFKMIPRIVNLDDPGLDISFLVKPTVAQYNETPFIARTSFSAFQGTDYFEVVVDVHKFSWLALSALSGLKSSIKCVVFDIAMVLQGDTDEELPEQVLAAARVFKLTHDTVPFLPVPLIEPEDP